MAGDDRSLALARLFGVTPEIASRAFNSGAPPPAPAPPVHTPMGPAPGDPGFAAGIIGGQPTLAPAGPPRPLGPAPGEPGFNLDDVGPAPSTPPPPSAPVMNLPKGAGQVDTSMVAPAGFGSGAVSMKPLPKGAGQIDMSEAGPSGSTASHAQGGPPQSGGGGSSGGHYLKPQWTPGSRSESVQHGLNPAALAEGQKQRGIADNYGQWANEKTLQAAQEEGAAEGAFAAAREQAVVQERQRAQRTESERQAYVIREHEKLEELSTAARAQVDPEAAKGSSGAQLFAALGIALGQFGASLSGGTNTALQIVNSNIDRRINAQRDNINNAHRDLANEQGLYRENLAAFGDKERASAATKMQYLDQAKSVLDQQYANAKGTRNEAKYMEMSQGLADRKAAASDQWGIATTDRSTTQQSDRYFPGGMSGGAAVTPEAKKDAHGYSQDLEKAGIPKALAGLQDIDQRLDSLGTGDIAGVGTVKNHIPGVLLSKEGVANRQAIAHIKNALRKEVAGASLTPGEKAELDKDLEGSGDAASLRNFVQSYRRGLSNQQRSIGAAYSEEGRALYHQRGGPVADIATNKGTTPYLRPVDGTRPDEPDADKKPQYRSKR